MSRSYDWQRVRSHRPYTVESLAALYGVNVATVRRWIRSHGLDIAVVATDRPMILSGRLTRDWMRKREDGRKQPCGRGEVYCVACKAPRRLKDETAHIVLHKPPKMTVEGDCDACGLTLRRFANMAERGDLEASFGLKRAGPS